MTTKPDRNLIELGKRFDKGELDSKAILEKVIDETPEVKAHLLNKGLIKEI